MLDIETFDARQGGNVLYKALAHPLAAEAIGALLERLAEIGPAALFDPDGTAVALLSMYPPPRPFAARYVQDVAHVGHGAGPRAGSARAGSAQAGLAQAGIGLPGRPVTELPRSSARSVLVAAFDAERIAARVRSLVPGAEVLTLDEARLPAAMLTNPRRYLDRLNFATNFAFFREADGLSTRLVTANYWSGYGAGEVWLWLRLFGEDGTVLATWEQDVPPGPASIVIDSAEIRARFDLPEFRGQLFVHAVGVAGHDVVKYALDTYGSGNDASLSVTHDANAWPSDRYAGIPAPVAGERVLLWLQNSHAVPIPAGAVSLDRMGAERPVVHAEAVAPFASVALDVGRMLPDVAWPAQLELRCGRHVVRPRYEAVREGRTRIAHANVERAGLAPDPGIATLPPELGRGYLLPMPVLPRREYRTLLQPNPMAESQHSLPIRVEAFDPEGRLVAARFLGNLPRDHAVVVDLDALLPDPACLAEGGHVELRYDFTEGGEADGWLHAIIRAEHRTSAHVAESSFGAHIFNTLMTYRDEPQSYSGPPPGLSTRLFLKMGHGGRHSFAHLIYPSSTPWAPRSSTALVLFDAAGTARAEAPLAIACSGSAIVFPHVLFGAEAVAAAGDGAYVLIRDATCRLFGYHGVMDDRGGFSLDHMFGF